MEVGDKGRVLMAFEEVPVCVLKSWDWTVAVGENGEKHPFWRVNFAATFRIFAPGVYL